MLTLEQAKVGMADKVDQNVVDVFRRESFLLDNLPFDNAISPGTGGSTLVYGYMQTKTHSSAGKRDINGTYTASEAVREEKTAKAIVMGGSFKIDRVIQDTSGAIDEMAYQMEDKIQATANYFHYVAINGTKEGTGEGYVTSTFDGLRKLLEGSDTVKAATVDISSSALMDENCHAFLDEVDAWLRTMTEKPTMLLMNGKMLTKMCSIARRAGYYSRSEDAFGRPVDNYNGIPMIDAGQYYDATEEKSIDVIEVTTPSSSAYGTTSIYAVKTGVDAFHGISPQGNNIVKTYVPDFTKPGAVQEGEVELVAGVVLKNTRKAGILTGIKIEPKTGA